MTIGCISLRWQSSQTAVTPQIVSIAEEEDGKKTFRQKGVHDMSKEDLQAVVKAAMATTDPDNRVYLTRLKERMDK